MVFNAFSVCFKFFIKFEVYQGFMAPALVQNTTKYAIAFNTTKYAIAF